jgi:hypothetical protein
MLVAILATILATTNLFVLLQTVGPLLEVLEYKLQETWWEIRIANDCIFYRKLVVASDQTLLQVCDRIYNRWQWISQLISNIIYRNNAYSSVSFQLSCTDSMNKYYTTKYVQRNKLARVSSVNSSDTRDCIGDSGSFPYRRSLEIKRSSFFPIKKFIFVSFLWTRSMTTPILSIQLLIEK